jgi:hypothetical protein
VSCYYPNGSNTMNLKIKPGTCKPIDWGKIKWPSSSSKLFVNYYYSAFLTLIASNSVHSCCSSYCINLSFLSIGNHFLISYRNYLVPIDCKMQVTTCVGSSFCNKQSKPKRSFWSICCKWINICIP